MKFIHTSDWHIGRLFHNVSLLDDQRHVLNQLLSYIEQEKIDALLIAGDIYDRSIPHGAAVELLDEILAKISLDLAVPIIMISGNHDSAQRLRFGSKQLRQAGLHIIGSLAEIDTPVVIKSEGDEVAFYGIPYTDPESVRNHFGVQVSSYDEAHSYLVSRITHKKFSHASNVLISHCFIDGAEESDSERALSIGGADRVSYRPCIDFDYVALGHLHSPQQKGAAHIRYSGSILKYSFSEQNQKKGVNLVELNAKGLQSCTHLPLLPLRNTRVVEGHLNTIIEQGKVDPNRDDYLLVRLADQHALLDPMNKLRAVYPNVLQLEKPGMLGGGDPKMNHEKLKHDELKLFRDFYFQIKGLPLSEDQDKAITDVIRGVKQSGEEQI